MKTPNIPKGYRSIRRGKWDRRRDKFWNGRRWCRQDAAHGLRIDRWKDDVIIRKIERPKPYWKIADETFTEACYAAAERGEWNDREAMTRVVNAVLRAYRRRNAK